MPVMILKMSAITALYVLLTAFLWTRYKGKLLTVQNKLVIGVVYGMFAVLSTHFGVDYGHMMLNVRDIGPLAAGLFFDPVSGIIAGLLGGIERYIAGTYFDPSGSSRLSYSNTVQSCGRVVRRMVTDVSAAPESL